MNKKAISISENLTMKLNNNPMWSLKSQISPTSINLIHKKTSIAQTLKKSSTLSSSIKNTNKAHIRMTSVKRLDKLLLPLPENEPISVENIDSIEKCREIFDEIIKQDKNHGKLLKQIKEVYEKAIQEKQVGEKKKANLLWKPKPVKVRRFSVGSIKNNYTRNDTRLESTDESNYPRILLRKKSEIIQNCEFSSPKCIVPKLSLNSVPASEFHDEFMGLYDEFSESWRNLIKNKGK